MKALLACLALVLLSACGLAAAQSTNRVHVPAAARNASLSDATATPTPTPIPAATPTPTHTPTPAPSGLAILSHTTRPASLSGYHYVIAKVHNYGPQTYYSPRVTVTFYNDSGQVAGSDYSYTTFSMLRGGEVSHSRLITQPQAGWTSYTVSVSGRDSTFLTYHHDGLDISGLNSYRSGSTVYVVGMITNNTGKTIRYAKVDVGIYDPNGGIIETDYTYPWSSSDTAPGASTSFSVQFYDPSNRIPSGYTYTARAEGRE